MLDFHSLIAEAADDAAPDTEARLQSGCRKLGLVSIDEKYVGVESIFDWSRTGAESWSCTGNVLVRNNSGKLSNRPVFAKAYAGFTVGISAERRAIAWRDRALALSRGGVSVCQIFSVFRGVLFQEYLHWSVMEILTAHPKSQRGLNLLTGIMDLGQRLDSLRVHPITLLYDLRTDGERIVVVDLGEDLGRVPGQSGSPDHCSRLLDKELAESGLRSINQWMDQ